MKSNVNKRYVPVILIKIKYKTMHLADLINEYDCAINYYSSKVNLVMH